MVRTALTKSTQRQAKFANRHHRPAPRFRRGQFVWLSTRNLPLRLSSKKLGPRYIGPFRILSRITPVTFRLALPPTLKIHPSFHVSLLKPFYRSPLVAPQRRPPPPRHIQGHQVYTVHKILDSRWNRGTLQYLADWEGYGPEERSWVPEKDILDPTLIRDFHRDYPDRSSRASGAAREGGGLLTNAAARVKPPAHTPPCGAQCYLYHLNLLPAARY
ncbi:CBX2 protein, partial [Atractosteus spatula]|nr:CBX2 protein [Atractosteus spatula]